MRNRWGGKFSMRARTALPDSPAALHRLLSWIYLLKLVYSYFAVALAEAGFRSLCPMRPEHGARYQGDEQGRMQRFWPILMQNFAGISGITGGDSYAGMVC